MWKVWLSVVVVVVRVGFELLMYMLWKLVVYMERLLSVLSVIRMCLCGSLSRCVNVDSVWFLFVFGGRMFR